MKPLSAVVALVVVLVATLAPGVRAERRTTASLDARRVVELTNQSRRQAGLPPLVVDEKLTAAARAKLYDMLEHEYFAHRTPDGRQPWTFMQVAGYRFQMAAENLAKGFESEAEMQDAWMDSKGHRANILNAAFTDIGVADANGIVVVLFGRPLPARPRR